MVGFSGLDGFLVFFFFPQVSPLLRVCVAVHVEERGRWNTS